MLRFVKCLLFVSLLVVIGCSHHKDADPGKPGTGNTTIHPSDFLSDAHYDKLIVEVQYVSGNAPSPSTINNLKSFLEQRLKKPAGVSIVQNEIASPGKTTFSLAEIESVEAAHRTLTLSGKTLIAYFLFVDGDYAGNAGDSKILGIAYGSTSMVIFEKTVLAFSGGLGEPSTTTLETTVIEHEFGHTLGLVNNGTSMVADHQDAAHGRHCQNTNCLMYYSVETSDVIGNIAGGNIPTFDSECLADLQANGGK